jgi:hypothetical protein
LPHWQALLRCLIKLPVVSTKEQAFQILWADKTWDDQVSYFLAGHDPSSIVNIEKSITMEMPYFDTHFLNNGIISNSAKKFFSPLLTHLNVSQTLLFVQVLLWIQAHQSA